MHVSDYSSLRSLDDQIREGNNSTFNGMKNYFLINVPSRMENDIEGIKRLFEDSPLSYNSLTFAFLITNKTHGIILLFNVFYVIEKDVRAYHHHGAWPQCFSR